MRIANVLIAVGAVVVAVGVVLRFAPWLLGWFGRLPGDVRIERDGVHVFIPITSSIVVSVLLSLLLALLSRIGE